MANAPGSGIEAPATPVLSADSGPCGPEPDYPIEADAIAARRQTYDIAVDAPLRALSLSGGGIRSATFSLGLLRGLSSLKHLQAFDYLSTVSGGGYAGSFYCGLFAWRGTQDPVVTPRADDDLLGQPDAERALGYLRQSGRYLTPAGFRDYVFALALLARNWLALAMVVGLAIMLLELGVDYFRATLADFSLLPSPHFPGLTTLATLYAAHLWISPVVVLLVPIAMCLLGTAWAYWLTMSDVSFPLLRPPLWGTVIVIIGAGWLATGQNWPDRWTEQAVQLWTIAAIIILIIAVKALFDWIVAFVMCRNGGGRSDHGMAMVEDRVRSKLTGWQAYCGMALLWLGLLALADSFSFAATRAVQIDLPFLATLTGLIVPIGRWLVRKLSALQAIAPKGEAGAARSKLLARFAPLLVWAAALVFILAAFAFWGGIAHMLALSDGAFMALSERPVTETTYFDRDFYWPALIITIIFVILVWQTRAFSNLSSLATFYAARLRRAYLGAGNRARIGMSDRAAVTGEAERPCPVHLAHKDDDLGLFSYYARSRKGAPVHLINVTVNATRGHGPATVQRDRHGLNMVISPDGMSYSLSPLDPVVIKPLGHVIPHEDDIDAGWRGPKTEPPGQSLPLSTWIGISGAAFSTGLGSQTSLAKAVLAFLANVRLGYWWNSDRRSIRWSGCYPSLAREMFASFHGTDLPQWYLSDGGHFENSGVYELVRRKLPFIVVSDNGCDPNYQFEDLGNLVRKCRIDFGAHIDILSRAALEAIIPDPALRALFGAPADFAAEVKDKTAIALLGRIRYCDGSDATLIMVKPRLAQDVPSDIDRYAAANPTFPQQTTLDQFFDEAQWESYFELGRRTALRLFRHRPIEGWQPAALRPVQWPDELP